MKLEIYEKWEEALSSFGNVEELLKEGKSEEAAGKADFAVWLACAAVGSLSKELEIPHFTEKGGALPRKVDK